MTRSHLGVQAWASKSLMVTSVSLYNTRFNKRWTAWLHHENWELSSSQISSRDVTPSVNKSTAHIIHSLTVGQQANAMAQRSLNNMWPWSWCVERVCNKDFYSNFVNKGWLTITEWSFQSGLLFQVIQFFVVMIRMEAHMGDGGVVTAFTAFRS